jgi:exodeoxyribonuclease VII large subunit
LHAPTYIKLSELTHKVKEVVQAHFGELTFWIVAEVSGHKFYPNPERHYLEFLEKDDANNQPIAKVKGIAWSGGAASIKIFEETTGQKFINGIQILTKVKVEFNAAHGFQLILLEINQDFTIGKIEQQKRDTLAKLLRENADKIVKVGEEIVTFNKKIIFAPVLQRIAVIGSPNSEGFSDFSHTIQSNIFGYKFVLDIYQSSVQGEGADLEIKAKLLNIFNASIPYHAVVLIRGGGSKSDLLTFDSYNLAQTVARFPIPIITGLGHHNDVSIVDLMAHTATKTPTKAAEFIIAHNRVFEEKIIALQQGILIKSQQILAITLKRISEINFTILNKSRQILAFHKEENYLLHQLITHKTKDILYNNQRMLLSLFAQLSSKPTIIIGNRLGDLSNIQSNLKLNTNKFLLNQKGFLQHHASVVRMMNPENILKKGFAIISVKGKIVANANSIQVGDEMHVTMEKQEILTQVKQINNTDGNNT